MKKLYKANIFHKRYHPRVNKFNYGGYYIKFSVDHIDQLRGPIFGVNSFNLFSFYESDHGYKDIRSLRQWAEDILTAGGLERPDEIYLQTFPRILGYVFNPVSFWYCYKKGKQIAIICEVNNTFGESHNYLLNKNKMGLPKEFHVSPFYPVEGHYEFDFSKNDMAVINYFQGSQLELVTYIKGDEVKWSLTSLIKLFISYPLYTFMVVFLIHYQALKLFFKKCKFYTKPDKGPKEITYELNN
jgi:DUF1365 family protein